MLNDLTGWISDVIAALGYAGLAFLVALESVFPPIPSEAVLPLAGFAAGRGDAHLVGMLAAATAGSVAGAWVLYSMAAWIGASRLRTFVARHGRWVGVSEADLNRAEAWFDRRAYAAVLLGRCVPLVRSVVSVPAGFRRMPALPFTLCTAAGSAVWNASLIGAGAVLGERWERARDVVGLLQGAVIVTLLGGLLALLWFRVLRPRFVGSSDPTRPDGGTR